MKKLLKIVLGFVALVLLALIAAYILIDPDRYRAEISAKASEALGTEVRLEGPLKLSLWPSIGLSTHEVKVLQPREFGDGLWLEAGTVSFSAAITPLLEGRLELGEIHLENVRLKLIRNRKGLANWELLTQTSVQKSEATGEKQNAEPLKFKLAGLYLDDVQLEYVDEQQQSTQLFTIRSMSLVGLGSGKPATLKLQAELSTPTVWNLKVESQLQPDEEMKQVAIRNLSARLQSEVLPKAIEAQGDMQLNLQTGGVEVNQLVLLNGIQVKGSIDKQVQMQVKASNQDMSPWLQGAPLKEGALGPLNLDLSIQGSAENLRVNVQQLQMAPVQVRGQLSWDGSLRARLNMAALNLDELLQPQASDGGSAVREDAPLMQPSDLPALKSSIALQLEGLQVQGLKLQQIQMEVRSQPGQMQVKQLSAHFYEGKLQLDAQLLARNEHVLLSSKGGVQSVQAEPLLQDLAGKAWLSGQGGVQWDIHTSLASSKALQQALNGQAALRFENGAVLGINIAERIREAWALLNGQPYEPPKEAPKTDFAELSASVTMTNGVINNPDFKLKSPLLRVEGQGSLNLPQKQVDYALTPVLVGTLTGQQGEELTQLKGVPIPLKIKGNLLQPSIKLDLARAFTESQKKKLKKKAEKEVLKLLFGKPKQDKEQQNEPPPPAGG